MLKTAYTPFTLERLASLGSFLDERLKQAPCDHTLRITKEWILAEGFARQAKPILRELARRGGCCCDCEVLTNAVGMPIGAA